MTAGFEVVYFEEARDVIWYIDTVLIAVWEALMPIVADSFDVNERWIVYPS